jgi:hypothetical protein
MAIIKRIDGAYLIRQGPPLQFGTLRQSRSFMPLGLQAARDLSAQLRAAGSPCYAADDSGNFNDENYVAPTQAVSLEVSWPADWRVSVSELGTNRYCHSYRNQHGEQKSVIGTSPQDVVSKLAFQGSVDPDVPAYLASITPEPEVVVPALPPPPVDEGPRKFLRPGSRGEISEAEYAEMNARRAAAQAPKAPPRAVEYAQYWNDASIPVAEKRRRSNSEPDFKDWLDQVGAYAPKE